MATAPSTLASTAATACDFDSLAERALNPDATPRTTTTPPVPASSRPPAAAFHILALTLSLHLFMIPASLARARLAACLELARGSKRLTLARFEHCDVFLCLPPLSPPLRPPPHDAVGL